MIFLGSVCIVTGLLIFRWAQKMLQNEPYNRPVIIRSNIGFLTLTLVCILLSLLGLYLLFRVHYLLPVVVIVVFIIIFAFSPKPHTEKWIANLIIEMFKEAKKKYPDKPDRELFVYMTIALFQSVKKEDCDKKFASRMVASHIYDIKQFTSVMIDLLIPSDMRLDDNDFGETRDRMINKIYDKVMRD